MTRDFAGAGFLAPYLPAWPTDLEQGQRWHFESLEALADFTPARPTPHAWTAECWTDNDSHRGATMAEARRMAREGWPAGAERIRAITDRISLDRPHLPRIARWDVAGAVASVPRHLAGNPMAMRRIVAQTTPRRPVVTLVAAITCPWDIKPEAFIQSAAVAAALADRLESVGFRVEIISAGRSYDHVSHKGPEHTGHRQNDVAFIAKRAEDPLDLETLAFSLGHPALSRRMVFAIVQTGRPCRRDGKQIGGSVRLDKHPDRPAGSYFLPIPGTYQGNDLQAFDQACQILRTQGCPGIPETLAA